MTEGTIEKKKGRNIERRGWRGERAGQTACKQLANLKRLLDALQFSDKAQPAEAAADQRRCMHPPALACPPLRWAWHIRSHSARLGENENYLKTVFNLPVNLIAPGTALRWHEGVEQMALGRPYFAFLVPPRCFGDYYVPILALPLALQSDASLNSLFRFVL